MGSNDSGCSSIGETPAVRRAVMLLDPPRAVLRGLLRRRAAVFLPPVFLRPRAAAALRAGRALFAAPFLPRAALRVARRAPRRACFFRLVLFRFFAIAATSNRCAYSRAFSSRVRRAYARTLQIMQAARRCGNLTQVTTRVTFGVMLLLTMLARPAIGQPARAGGGAPQDESEALQKGRVEVGVLAGGALPVTWLRARSDRRTTLGSLEIGRVLTGRVGGGPLSGRFEMLLDLTPLIVVHQPIRAWGVAASPLHLRWNLSPVRPGGARLFAEASGALLLAPARRSRRGRRSSTSSTRPASASVSVRREAARGWRDTAFSTSPMADGSSRTPEPTSTSSTSGSRSTGSRSIRRSFEAVARPVPA